MTKLALSSVCLSLSLALSACQSLDGLLGKEESATKVETQVVDLNQANQNTNQKQYEQTPDLSGAEVLTVNTNQGGLISDASIGVNYPNANGQTINMQTAPDQVEQSVQLSDQLEQVNAMDNVQIAAVASHESALESEEVLSNQNITFDQNALNQNMADTGYIPPRPAPQTNGVYNNNPYNQPATLDSSCPANLQNSANILATQLIRELATRLRSDQGEIFIAPTIIDQEYTDCVRDLSPAIKVGLNNNPTFIVSAGNTNLSNVVSQNIGSATILPSLIHQCRIASIPYLVISQIKKTGDNASLSIRIIRTEDGITLTQKYVRIN